MINDFFASAKVKLQQRTENIEHQFVPASIAFLIGYLSFYFFWSELSPVAYESFPLRLIAAIIVLPLIFKNMYPRKYFFLLSVYWYLVLLYLIPFFFTFMLLKNNASLSAQLNVMVGVTVLAILTNWKEAVLLTIIGVAIAILAYINTTEQLFWSHDLVGIFVNEMCIIIFVAFFTSKKTKLQETKLQTIKSISANMAHELRTPLRTIASSVSGLRKYLPELFRVYEGAKVEGDAKSPTQINCKALQRSLENIETEAEGAFTIINMLMVAAGMANALIDQEPVKTCSIASCIETALQRYPFDLREKELIHWSANANQIQDFHFSSKELLVVHVLFNLLKNAFYHIKKAGKGEVFLWLSQDKKHNFLHFKDTGSGIPEKKLRHIFDQFYSNTIHGTGIGLAFCKMVMQNLGGDISCFSREKEFAEFVLSFPR